LRWWLAIEIDVINAKPRTARDRIVTTLLLFNNLLNFMIIFLLVG
jgi:hypothetical protein